MLEYHAKSLWNTIQHLSTYTSTRTRSLG